VKGFLIQFLDQGVINSLFELQSSGVESSLEEEITTLLNNFEPRISLNSVIVQIIEDSNELEVKISYNIVGLPIPNQNIEFILQPSKV